MYNIQQSDKGNNLEGPVLHVGCSALGIGKPLHFICKVLGKLKIMLVQNKPQMEGQEVGTSTYIHVMAAHSYF